MIEVLITCLLIRRIELYVCMFTCIINVVRFYPYNMKIVVASYMYVYQIKLVIHEKLNFKFSLSAPVILYIIYSPKYCI